MSLLGPPPVPLFGLQGPWLSGSSWWRSRRSWRLKEVLRVSPSRTAVSSAHFPWLPSCHLAWHNTLDRWCLVWLWAQEVQGTCLATEAGLYPQVSVRMDMGQVQRHVQRDSCRASRWSWALLMRSQQLCSLCLLLCWSPPTPWRWHYSRVKKRKAKKRKRRDRQRIKKTKQEGRDMKRRKKGNEGIKENLVRLNALRGYLYLRRRLGE